MKCFRLKKSKYLLILIPLIILVAGCSTEKKSVQTTGTREVTEEKKNVTKPVIIDGLELIIKTQGVKELINSEQKKQQVYVISVESKNVASSEKGIGAIDFKLKLSNKKVVDVTTELSSFGDSIQSGEKLIGELYFPLKDGDKPIQLQYMPANDVLYSWEVD
ncbi:DUF4352 domain-containing protein [Enterococcus faecalis]|uniref:DUF4352 domain-containing protein n=1 Tax=Enterococcus faecalis TaxID=1351 RepID=UPI00115ECB7D|nr:DUF4352 domain-containing protein [Enterococcus faecalis]EHU9676999.1 DUF4352 domain-containing protein [Enterococcus faecalis]EIA6407655.1 DUF4352 domain-containing protein [Enterococcus faecalis]